MKKPGVFCVRSPSDRIAALVVDLSRSTVQDALACLPYDGEVKVEDAFKVIEEYKEKVEAVRATQVRRAAPRLARATIEVYLFLAKILPE